MKKVHHYSDLPYRLLRMATPGLLVVWVLVKDFAWKGDPLAITLVACGRLLAGSLGIVLVFVRLKEISLQYEKIVLTIAVVAYALADLAGLVWLRSAFDMAGFLPGIIFILIIYSAAPREQFILKKIILAAYTAGLIVILVFFREVALSEKILVGISIGVLHVVCIPHQWVTETIQETGAPEEADNQIAPASSHDMEDLILTKLAALSLSEREKDVAHLFLLGKSRSEIASSLFVSEETVKKHLAHIYKKLRVTSRSEFFRLVLEGKRS
ncbi:MAG: helix-turn-helix transcriptional regulator [Spirochaetaceae bacterium]|nr:helix-turn-helix transcriptional regulator [Spirochaetaceae bacterium]